MPDQWLLTYLGPQDYFDDPFTQRRFYAKRAFAVDAAVKDRLTEHTFRSVYRDTWNAEPLVADAQAPAPPAAPPSTDPIPWAARDDRQSGQDGAAAVAQESPESSV